MCNGFGQCFNICNVKKQFDYLLAFSIFRFNYNENVSFFWDVGSMLFTTLTSAFSGDILTLWFGMSLHPVLAVLFHVSFISRMVNYCFLK